MRTIKKKGFFSEDFSLKKKESHFVRLSILVQNSILQQNPSFQTNIGYISRGSHLLVKLKWASFSESMTPIFTDKYFSQRGSLSERAF